MTSPVLDAIAALHDAVDEVFTHLGHGGLAQLSDAEFVDAATELEATRRRMSTLDYPIVAEVETRELPAQELARDAAGYLAKLWRLAPGQARGRVREAAELGERRTLTGEVLPPLRPYAAEQRRLGILDADHVRVILRAFDQLPPWLTVEQAEQAERILVDAGRALNPNDLARVATALVDAADPDGPEPDDSGTDPRRELTLIRRRDGWGRLHGLLDPEATAMLDAWLAARSRPRPEDDTGRDTRTPPQRRHDALTELLSFALRADEHTRATGSPVTVHLSMTAEQFEYGTGHAVTSLGQHIPVPTALRLADQARIAWAVHDSRGSILAHGRNLRLATREQTEALLVRDGGCAFPSCDHPPQWCERHHVREWQAGGPTDLDNLVSLCRYHHARFAQQGWTIVMRDGVPEFLPPAFIDPERKPLRNPRTLGAGLP